MFLCEVAYVRTRSYKVEQSPVVLGATSALIEIRPVFDVCKYLVVALYIQFMISSPNPSSSSPSIVRPRLRLGAANVLCCSMRYQTALPPTLPPRLNPVGMRPLLLRKPLPPFSSSFFPPNVEYIHHTSGSYVRPHLPLLPIPAPPPPPRNDLPHLPPQAPPPKRAHHHSYRPSLPVSVPIQRYRHRTQPSPDHRAHCRAVHLVQRRRAGQDLEPVPARQGTGVEEREEPQEREV